MITEPDLGLLGPSLSCLGFAISERSGAGGKKTNTHTCYGMKDDVQGPSNVDNTHRDPYFATHGQPSIFSSMHQGIHTPMQ